MSQYIDEVEKLAYYKEQIMQQLTRVGVFPDMISVNERLADIDAKLSIYRHRQAYSGDEFDTKRFNKEFADIAEDLKIIYKLVYQLSVERYEKIKEFAETHVAEMQSMARKYQNKTRFEIDSTSLGSTIFFQANGFNLSYGNGTATINLGSIEAMKGSKLACIFDAENVAPENVVFSFDGKNCSPYDLNRDFFTVPGTVTNRFCEYTVPDGEMVNTAHIMNIKEFEPDADNKYVIYAGKNCIRDEYQFIEKQENTPITLSVPGEVEFYILGGTFINFDFSQQPLSKNFSGTSITNLKSVHKIIMEHGEGFTFNYVTDGTVYAKRAIGTMRDGKLYYPYGDGVSDFRIEEYYAEDKEQYSNVKVTVSGIKDDTPLTINNIAIKELGREEGLIAE